MTDNNHPITPPPELVQQWWDGTHGAFYEFEAVTTQAARWGADQELEACVEWVVERVPSWAPHTFGEQLCEARRPKPPSLKEQALNALQRMWDGGTTHAEWELVRRALEQLDD